MLEIRSFVMGEVSTLRQVPASATLVARDNVKLLKLERPVYLELNPYLMISNR